MFCQNCGKQVKDNMKFCTHCGSPMTEPIVNYGGSYVQRKGTYTMTSKAKNRFFICLIAGFFAVMVIAVSCWFAFGRNSIVGKWQQTEGNQIIEFYDDGTAAIDGVTVDYSLSNGQIVLHLFWATETFEYKLSGNTLQIMDDGEKEIYKRIK